MTKLRSNPAVSPAQVFFILSSFIWLFSGEKLIGQASNVPQATSAGKSTVSPALNPLAPAETEQFGRLVGDWQASKSTRNRDGSWTKPTVNAEWRWYYILDGHAIQDDWINISRSSAETEKKELIGTNIRIYNPDEKKWHMAWIDKNNRRLATFTATTKDGAIVMTGHNAKGRQVKNTFYNISSNDFDWKQEWTFDGGQTWLKVVKIHCTRKQI